MRFGALVLGATMLAGTAAHAGGVDKAKLKHVLEEAIHLEDERMNELNTVAKNDEKLANELENGVKAREKGAANWENKEREFKEFAELSSGKDKEEFENFAKEMRTFAEHDKGLAKGRREAMELLRSQAKGAAEGAANHKAHIEKMKARLARL
jgi:hypothetical protein